MEAPAAMATLFPSCKPSIFVGTSNLLPFRPKFQFSNKVRTSVSIPNQGHRSLSIGSRRGFVVRAASLSPEESSGSSSKFAPLQLESPIGQFLSEILTSHPHLLPAAVEQQLEQFQTDRDVDKRKEEPSASGTDLVLYRRIAEVKANERRKAIEEILYALVVQKFMDANISLVPALTPDPSGRVDSWPGQDGKLEELHSHEAYEMIQSHLSVIMGDRIGDPSSVAQISKLRVRQVYAASVMYGYFLKRVDQRFQLEKTMKILPNASEENSILKPGVDDARFNGGEARPHVMSHPEVSALPGGAFGYETKVSKLRSYVISFDGETLQRYATIRSKESVNIVEKHTEALFGRPEIVITPEGAIDSLKNESIKISFGGLKRLVLEAVTFGSFLWDVESYVDSRYHFVLN
ncbi:hypothetical protein Lal_00045774 [Lupinus albus]|uniref:Uncharacterized protein n=1 Tax=Lupinus albus TaxID=3870 RepID=A0A6A4PFE8_LUPAL|nr:hypothetical protein Lalb_Chr14g0370531 [Lupinus albus]KAF1886541.1 hypothetical protein Lal_00045774 [Lupinus albus]